MHKVQLSVTLAIMAILAIFIIVNIKAPVLSHWCIWHALRKILRIPHTNLPCDECGSRSMPVTFPSGQLRLFGHIVRSSPQSPPCYCCGDPETTCRLEATSGFVQWMQSLQTVTNWILASHLPGGRLLFVKTGGALWTQQRSSCERRKRIMRLSYMNVNVN